MLACRLCLAFGIDDPEQWLERCSRRKLNVWRAFAEVEGWFTERYLAAQTAVGIKRLVALKYARDDRQAQLKSIDTVAAMYLPKDYEQIKDEPQAMNPDILKAMARSDDTIKSPVHSIDVQMECDPWQQV